MSLKVGATIHKLNDGSSLVLGKSNFNYQENLDWFKFPKPEQIPVIGKVFPKKTDYKIRKLFHLLYARALENKGDTKLSNTVMAEYLGVTERTITRYIKALKDKKVIVTTEVKHKQWDREAGKPMLVNGKKTYKTERIIRVWLAFAERGYSPNIESTLMMERDIRPDVSVQVRKWPLKYKIKQDVVLTKKIKGEWKRIEVKKVFYNFEEMIFNGHLNYQMLIDIDDLKAMRDNGEHEGLRYIGYRRDNYIYRKRKRVKELNELKKIAGML